jgi:hypothetical protein
MTDLRAVGVVTKRDLVSVARWRRESKRGSAVQERSKAKVNTLFCTMDEKVDRSTYKSK